MTQVNQAPSQVAGQSTVLVDAITKYFGTNLANRRQSIKTSLIDKKITGANSTRNIQMESDLVVCLKANKSIGSMMLQMVKTASGQITLNCLFPFQHVTMNTNGSGISNSNVHILVPASSQEYERAVNHQKPEAGKAITFGNGNLAAISRTFASKCLNGCIIAGNMTTAYIPKLANVWAQPYYKQLDNKQISVGEAINQITRNIWRALKDTESSDVTAAEKEARYSELWEQYTKAHAVWIAKGYLDTSNVIYADENSIEPGVFAFLGVNAAADELNAKKIYGTLEGQMSFTPNVNRVNACALITNTTESESGKFQYGIYTAGRKAEERIVLEDDDLIAKTVEICTKEIQIVDGAGRDVLIQARARDIAFGTGENVRPIKLSRNLASIPEGAMVQLRGTLNFRPVREGSQAIRFEVDVTSQRQYMSNNNLIIGDITTEDEIIDESSFNFDDEFEQLQANQSTVDDNVNVQTDTSSDADMNS